MSELQYQERIVSFVDILGFSKEVMSSGSVGLSGLKKKIDRFRSAFDDWRDTSEDLRSHYKDDVICLSFSDGLLRAKKIADYPMFWEVLGYVHSIAEIVHSGYLVRGAITHGDFYFDDASNTLISPAFITAYNLESKCAITPRVIVDPKTLEEFKNRKDWWKVGHSYRDESEHVYKCLRLDSDGYYFIDYLKASCDEMNYPPYDYPRFVKAHQELIIAGLKSPEISVKKKYVWLGNYHNTVLSEFSNGEPDSEWGAWKDGLEIGQELLQL